MIISFSVENWMSFRDSTKFSMLASRERQHGERLPRVGKYKTRVLPISSIYGSNASGKTNLFKALSFARSLIVDGTQPDSLIKVDPFVLDPKYTDKPSRFSFELLIDDNFYEYSFTVNNKSVLEEKFVNIHNVDRVMYERKNGKISFDKSLEKDQFFHFTFRGTRSNQLFLTNTVLQNIDIFKPVYDWFKHTLVLVAPDSRFGNFEQFIEGKDSLYTKINDMLSQLDTGIIEIGSRTIPFESSSVPKGLESMLQKELEEGATLRLAGGASSESFLITKKRGKLTVKMLTTYHPCSDGKKVNFKMSQESDGTRRVLDLIPAFLDLSAPDSKKVYVIDEIDRSLHTLLTRQLLEGYLSSCSSKSRSQLLFTTHDVLLMDQQLLRRDEMWVTERDLNGAITIISFSEYKDVRYDKDIRKSYLQGRLGGIPHLFYSSCRENIGDKA